MVALSDSIVHPGIRRVIDVLSNFLHGKEQALRLALICFFARGHLLIEDLPGLGKTTLAIGIARALGMDFGRIQCTSDLLPSDVTGLSIFDQQRSIFEFKPGPIFHNIVLVDEINRAPPKTQSALLEAMGEKQVTVEGRTYPLPVPFFVIATQNPLESFGTFPLPESQMDRFMMKISIGYPSREAEREILRGGSRRRELYSLDPVLTQEEILEIQESARKNVHVSDLVLDYLQNIVALTRTSPLLRAGLSTRGALALLHTSRVDAFFKGKEFVSPENIRSVAPYVISHRILPREEYRSVDRMEVVRSLLEEVPVPVY
ncbi:AAA family ATPase [Thermodesulforhabdus norvegica]|uniref:MoxR-like ATPase n=1 Tax=Thermodesulforhabdus norvegica TaxID=39841 RepID=A0A1I4VE49_9BACT|nr:MoxR family ATPase [Thermodesulforhabdus norvegica]SFM99514.1 MoxR-like ATPase [Thermodesulforhabdus norvegica]